ncbi:MAG: hypothetical protein IM638_11410 [Bacteroidetes bacterium]|nr:hypothetical protein [Bacteroidota bacterium]
MKRFSSFLVLPFLLLLAGCAKQALEPVQYRAWVEDEDNGLKVVKNVGDLVFTLQHCPIDYLILREQDQTPTTEQMNTRRKDLQGAEYYHLRIGTKNKSDVMQYGNASPEDLIRRSDALNFAFQQSIFLCAGTDTLPCTVYQFENSYGLSPDIVINLGFATDAKTQGQPRELFIDEQLFGTGPLYLKINSSAIQSTPLLRL